MTFVGEAWVPAKAQLALGGGGTADAVAGDGFWVSAAWDALESCTRPLTASSPHISTSTRPPAAFFSGTIGADATWTVNALPETERREDGVVEGSGESYTYPRNANDPRISGMATIITNETDYREGATTLAPTGDIGTVRTGLIGIVNDEGSWEGPYTNLQIDNLQYDQSAGWLTGTGVYEGLTAYVVWVFGERSIRGHISAEGPPPAPESLPE